MEALQYPGRLSQGISRRRPAKRHWLHHLDSAIAAEHLLSARSLGHPLLLSLVLGRRGRTQSGHVEMYAAHRRRMMEADLRGHDATPVAALRKIRGITEDIRHQFVPKCRCRFRPDRSEENTV